MAIKVPRYKRQVKQQAVSVPSPNIPAASRAAFGNKGEMMEALGGVVKDIGGQLMDHMKQKQDLVHEQQVESAFTDYSRALDERLLSQDMEEYEDSDGNLAKRSRGMLNWKLADADGMSKEFNQFNKEAFHQFPISVTDRDSQAVLLKRMTKLRETRYREVIKKEALEWRKNDDAIRNASLAQQKQGFALRVDTDSLLDGLEDIADTQEKKSRSLGSPDEVASVDMEETLADAVEVSALAALQKDPESTLYVDLVDAALNNPNEKYRISKESANKIKSTMSKKVEQMRKEAKRVQATAQSKGTMDVFTQLTKMPASQINIDDLGKLEAEKGLIPGTTQAIVALMDTDGYDAEDLAGQEQLGDDFVASNRAILKATSPEELASVLEGIIGNKDFFKAKKGKEKFMTLLKIAQEIQAEKDSKVTKEILYHAESVEAWSDKMAPERTSDVVEDYMGLTGSGMPPVEAMTTAVQNELNKQMSSTDKEKKLGYVFSSNVNNLTQDGKDNVNAGLTAYLMKTGMEAPEAAAMANEVMDSAEGSENTAQYMGTLSQAIDKAAPMLRNESTEAKRLMEQAVRIAKIDEDITKDASKMGFGGKTAESFNRGNISMKVNLMTYETLLMGKGDYFEDVQGYKLKFQQEVSEDPIDGGNWFADVAYGVSGMAPVLGMGLGSGLAVGVPAGAAGFGLGLLTPIPGDELVYGLAAGKLGQTVGSADLFYREGAGGIAGDLADEGIPESIYKPIAHIGGLMYGGLEFAQMSWFFRGANKLFFKRVVSDSVKRAAAKMVANYGIGWAGEVTQEGLQEVTIGVSKDIAHKLFGDDKTKREIFVNAVSNMGRGMYEAAGPMLFMVGTKAGVETPGNIKHEKSKVGHRNRTAKMAIDIAQLNEMEQTGELKIVNRPFLDMGPIQEAVSGDNTRISIEGPSLKQRLEQSQNKNKKDSKAEVKPQLEKGDAPTLLDHLAQYIPPEYVVRMDNNERLRLANMTPTEFRDYVQSEEYKDLPNETNSTVAGEPIPNGTQGELFTLEELGLGPKMTTSDGTVITQTQQEGDTPMNEVLANSSKVEVAPVGIPDPNKGVLLKTSFDTLTAAHKELLDKRKNGIVVPSTVFEKSLKKLERAKARYQEFIEGENTDEGDAEGEMAELDPNDEGGDGAQLTVVPGPRSVPTDQVEFSPEQQTKFKTLQDLADDWEAGGQLIDGNDAESGRKIRLASTFPIQLKDLGLTHKHLKTVWSKVAENKKNLTKKQLDTAKLLEEWFDEYGPMAEESNDVGNEISEPEASEIIRSADQAEQVDQQVVEELSQTEWDEEIEEVNPVQDIRRVYDALLNYRNAKSIKNAEQLKAWLDTQDIPEPKRITMEEWMENQWEEYVNKGQTEIPFFDFIKEEMKKSLDAAIKQAHKDNAAASQATINQTEQDQIDRNEQLADLKVQKKKTIPSEVLETNDMLNDIGDIEAKVRLENMMQKKGMTEDQVNDEIKKRTRIQNEGGFIINPIPSLDKDKKQEWYQRVFNRFQSIEDLVKDLKKAGANIPSGENAGLSADRYLSVGAKADATLNYGTYTTDANGKVKKTGEGLRPILESYDANSTEQDKTVRGEDLQKYLIAQRTISDLQRSRSQFDQTQIVSEGQVESAKQDMAALKAKYGDMALFEGVAKRMYSFQQRVLHSLVDSGNISQAKYDLIVKNNPNYIPFDRIMPDSVYTEVGGVPIQKAGFERAKAPIKKIKGSDLDVQPVLESVIKNTYKILDAAARNKVFTDVHSLSLIEDSPVKIVRPKNVPVATVTHRAAVDSKFMDKLIGFAESLGATFEREGQITKHLGAYYSKDKRITRKFATPREVLAHESGHFFDAKFGLKKRFYSRADTKAVVKEMKDHMKNMGETEKRMAMPSERFADAFEWWLTHRAQAQEDLPLFSAHMGIIIRENPQLQPLLDMKPTPSLSLETMDETIFRPSPFKPSGNVVEGYINGERTFIEVSKNVHEAMTGLNEHSSHALVRILAKPANWLRTGATITPEFMARNLVKDQFTAFLQTQLGFKPFFDSIGSIADIMGKSDLYVEWIQSGGAYGGFVETSRPALARLLKEIQKNPSLWKRMNIIGNLQDASQLFEQATRLGAYKAAKRKGMSDVEAGYEARESTVNFSRKGSDPWLQNFAATKAFFNASLQSFDKSIRSFQKDPVGLTVKGMATITVPSVLLYLRNREDPEYFEIPQWQRDLFWMFKVGDTWFRIPKPFGYGQIFGTLPERFLEYVDTKDPDSFKGLVNSLVTSVSPIPTEGSLGAVISTWILPFVEGIANWSFFRQRKLISEWDEKLVSEEQFNRYTSETAKELGKVINASPTKIENFVQNWAGASGKYALNIGDGLMQIAGGPVRPSRPIEASDVPFIRGFIARNPTGTIAESVSDFYEDRERITKLHNTYNRYQKRRDRKAAKELRDDNPEMKYYSSANTTANEISRIKQRIDQVINNDKWDDDKKRDKLEALDEQVMKKAQRFNKQLKRGLNK